MADKTYKIEAPDGRIMSISGPDNATNDQLMAAAQAAYKTLPPLESPPEKSLGKTLADAGGNFLPGLVELGKGVASAVTNPKAAGSAANDALRGLAMKIPGANLKLSPEDAARAQPAGNAIAKEYGDRYGSWAGFKNSFAENPVAPLLDATTVLSGGAGLAAKVPVLGKTLSTAAAVTNPLKPVEMGVNAMVSGGAKVAGRVADIGRGAELNAARIARDAAGPDLAVIQAANRANPDAPAGLAAAGVSGDSYQALAARGSRPDMSAVAAQLAKDESDLMTVGSRLRPPEKLQLEQRIRDAKATLSSVDQNAAQAAAGEGALNSMVSNATQGSNIPKIPRVAEFIPGVAIPTRMFNKGATLADGTLDLLQGTGKFKGETLQKIADGMASGKSANELLAALPTSEANKLLQLLQSKPKWLTQTGVNSAVQGVNAMNGDR